MEMHRPLSVRGLRLGSPGPRMRVRVYLVIEAGGNVFGEDFHVWVFAERGEARIELRLRF